jgi:hypothetical protein
MMPSTQLAQVRNRSLISCNLDSWKNGSEVISINWADGALAIRSGNLTCLIVSDRLYSKNLPVWLSMVQSHDKAVTAGAVEEVSDR